MHARFDKSLGNPFHEHLFGTINLTWYADLGYSWPRMISTMRVSHIKRLCTLLRNSCGAGRVVLSKESKLTYK